MSLGVTKSRLVKVLQSETWTSRMRVIDLATGHEFTPFSFSLEPVSVIDRLAFLVNHERPLDR